MIVHLPKDMKDKYLLLKTHLTNHAAVQLGLEIIMRKLENDNYDIDLEDTKHMFDELDENLSYYFESKFLSGLSCIMFQAWRIMSACSPVETWPPRCS